jgi:DNA polymerase I
MKRFFLVDGNSFVYRAFFATPYLSNSKGMPTNAIYAFISMIKKLINDKQPDGLVVVWDSKAPSFRIQLSEDYKATRPPMPGNLILQFPFVKAIVERMGIATVEQEGFEADDIIATLAEKLKSENQEVVIVTSDKDLMQLVNESVTVFDSMKNVMMGPDGVREKFGIEPILICDFLALSGDTSDNIPGVPGIGDKTARELITTYGGLDDIYCHIDEIKKPALRQKLIDNRDCAILSKKLATLRYDVPLDINEADLAIKNPDLAELRKIYKDLEFTGLYREIKIDDNEETFFEEVESFEGLSKDHLWIMGEIQGRSGYDAAISRFAVSDGNKVFYSEKEEDFFKVLIYADRIGTYNLKPFFAAAASKGINLKSRLTDVMLAVYLINPSRKDYSIDSVFSEYIDIHMGGNENDKERTVKSAANLCRLEDVIYSVLKEKGLVELFENIEMPLVEVLGLMECHGVKVDRSALAVLSREFNSRLNAIVTKIYDIAEETFNINSPQQLVHILFDKLNLPPMKKTKTSLSTDNEVLQALSGLHPLPAQILEYRMLTKLKSTYVDSLHTLIRPETGRIHASFNQMVVATGRLSSSDPNLQNIPIKGVEGKKIREAFVPEDGYLLVSSDYSQIELRVLAHISEDALLINAFINDQDIHTQVAKEVFRVDAGDVTPEMRRTAKVINFGIVYGISGFGLSKELGVSHREAQAYIDAYFERHKGIKDYIEHIIAEAKEKGFVRTLFGRIRYIPELSNTDANVRQFGERTAMNTPIQGTAADIIKMAMVNIHKKLAQRQLQSRLIMQIHDELVFEVPEKENAEIQELVKYEMENVCTLKVPLKVSLGQGKNWAEAHE